MKIINLIPILGCIGLLTACESFVEVPLPNNQLTAASVFESEATADAAMGNVYALMREGGLLSGSVSGTGLMLGLYTDELQYYGSGADGYDLLYNNTLQPNTSLTQVLWNRTYTQVYGCNAVLEGVAQSTLPLPVKERLSGEALFVRALLHTRLCGIYGSIPYVTTTDYIHNASLSRQGTQEIYLKAAQDLEQAATLLPGTYTGTGRIRPNRHACQLVLAEVKLYLGEWQQAEMLTSQVIGSGLYSFPQSLDQEFLVDSPAVLWQLGSTNPGDNASEGAAYIFTQGPPPHVALSPTLMAAFEPNDLRKEYWTRAVTNGTATWYHPYKYRQNANTGSTLEYSVILRLAEAYLIRCEAQLRNGNVEQARADLNTIRIRAGLLPATENDPAVLLDMLLHERQVELFTEYGHRFYDLKRFGMLGQALGPVKSGWDTTDHLWPVSEQELLANPNLNPQNPGY